MSDDPMELKYMPEPWLTSRGWDGQTVAPAPRRAELLGDTADTWWQDLRCWSEWAIRTFNIGHVFPPCWPRHTALVEELQALWLFWCSAWQSGTDFHGPVNFLAQLAQSINRCETLWQVSCRETDHRETETEHIASHQVTPNTTAWWSNPDLDERYGRP